MLGAVAAGRASSFGSRVRTREVSEETSGAGPLWGRCAWLDLMLASTAKQQNAMPVLAPGSLPKWLPEPPQRSGPQGSWSSTAGRLRMAGDGVNGGTTRAAHADGGTEERGGLERRLGGAQQSEGLEALRHAEEVVHTVKQREGRREVR